MECIKQLQFDAVEDCWTSFWQPENDQDDMEDDECVRTEYVLFFYSYFHFTFFGTLLHLKTLNLGATFCTVFLIDFFLFPYCLINETHHLKCRFYSM